MWGRLLVLTSLVVGTGFLLVGCGGLSSCSDSVQQLAEQRTMPLLDLQAGEELPRGEVRSWGFYTAPHELTTVAHGAVPRGGKLLRRHPERDIAVWQVTQCGQPLAWRQQTPMVGERLLPPR